MTKNNKIREQKQGDTTDTVSRCLMKPRVFTQLSGYFLYKKTKSKVFSMLVTTPLTVCFWYSKWGSTKEGVQKGDEDPGGYSHIWPNGEVPL